MKNPSCHGTKAALLTGSGRGAIAVVRVRGPEAAIAVDALFRPIRGPRLLESPPGRPRFGRFGRGQGDEVITVILDGSPPEVEIHGHGGIAASRLILDSLRDLGVEIAPSDRIAVDPSRPRWAGASELLLPGATTLRTAQILLDQCEGALDRELVSLARELGEGSAPARPRINTLLAHSRVGLRLIDGWRVVLTGRPNVGKSRLMNALAGFDRAVVSAVPGTTRDVVTVRTAIDGWPVELADTAGLHASSDPLESAGIALARERIATSDALLVVLDCSAPLTDEDAEVLAAYPLAIRVANKSDLEPAWDAASLAAISVSATRGDGLDSLLEAISPRLVPNPPPPGAAVPFDPDLVQSLLAVRDGPDRSQHFR